jgi:hypothetical protein
MYIKEAKCKDGFGPARCTRIMCDDGRYLMRCVFVQEWVRVRKMERAFGYFWENVVS